jgi:dTDP-4-amino-4,6-dideoxygalactose transaminase
MTDILASIGLIELKRYDSQTLKRRKEIFEAYTTAFSKYDWAITPHYKDAARETSYHLYLLRIKGFDVPKRNDMIQKIFDKDVSVNVHYKPLPLLTAYKIRGYVMEDYPVSKALWENEISLPVFYAMTDDQIQTVIDAIVKSYTETVSA